MSDKDTKESIELAKELMEEVKILKARIENLEAENAILEKNQEDPRYNDEEGRMDFHGHASCRRDIRPIEQGY